MSKTYNKNTALIMCVLGGWFGLHYFYVKKIGMGILYLFTLGLFCIGWWVDIYKICVGNFYKMPVVHTSDSDCTHFADEEKNDSAYWCFVDEHEKEFDRLVERYQNACTKAETACTDPETKSYYNIDKRLDTLQNAIFIYEEIDLFCVGKVGGVEYLNKEYPYFTASYISGYSFIDNEEDFSNCDFECYDFLQFLHDTYISNYSEYEIYLKNLQKK